MKVLFGCLLAAVFAVPLYASAAQTTSGVDAVASVDGSCQITHVDNINFGQYDPVVANNNTSKFIQTTSTLSVKCTAGMSGVALSVGKGSSPGQDFSCNMPRRHLKSDTGHVLPYIFYFNASRTRFWGCSLSSVTPRTGDAMTEILPVFTDSLNARTITIHPLLMGGQDVPEGIYIDTVDVGVTF